MNDFYSNLSDIMDMSEYCDYKENTEAYRSPHSEKIALHDFTDAPECECVELSPIPTIKSDVKNEVTGCACTSLNGFLRSQLGRRVNVEFVLGTQIKEKTGYLVAVGKNYIVLYYPATKDYAVCDFYSIKFITVYAEPGEEDSIL